MRTILTLAIITLGMVGQPPMAAATTVLGPVTTGVFIKKHMAKENKPSTHMMKK